MASDGKPRAFIDGGGGGGGDGTIITWPERARPWPLYDVNDEVTGSRNDVHPNTWRIARARGPEPSAKNGRSPVHPSA